MVENILTLARVFQENHPNWRWGQCVFNATHSICPSKANLYRGGIYDCFHRDDKVDIFLNLLDQIDA